VVPSQSLNTHDSIRNPDLTDRLRFPYTYML